MSANTVSGSVLPPAYPAFPHPQPEGLSKPNRSGRSSSTISKVGHETPKGAVS